MRHLGSNFSADKRGTRMVSRRHALWDAIIPAHSTGKQEEPT